MDIEHFSLYIVIYLYSSSFCCCLLLIITRSMVQSNSIYCTYMYMYMRDIVHLTGIKGCMAVADKNSQQLVITCKFMTPIPECLHNSFLCIEHIPHSRSSLCTHSDICSVSTMLTLSICSCQPFVSNIQLLLPQV